MDGTLQDHLLCRPKLMLIDQWVREWEHQGHPRSPRRFTWNKPFSTVNPQWRCLGVLILYNETLWVPDISVSSPWVCVWSFRRDVGEPALVIKWRHSDFAWLCKDSSVNRRCGDTPLLLWEMCWCWLQVGQDSGMSYLWLFTLHVICHCWYFVTNFNTLSMATGGLRLQSADDVRLGLEIGLYVNCRHSIVCQKCKCAISFHKHDSDILMQS